MPLYTEVASRLRAGDLPGWNPALFSGMPLAGDPISGWGYLPAMSFFALLGPLGAYQVHVYFHLALADWRRISLADASGWGFLGLSLRPLPTNSGHRPISPNAALRGCSLSRGSRWTAHGRARGTQPDVDWSGVVLGRDGRDHLPGNRRVFWQGRLLWHLTIGAYAAYRTLIDPPESLGLRGRLVAGVLHCGAILGFGFALSAATVLPRLDFMERANLEGGSYEAVAPSVTSATGWPVGRALTSILNPADPKFYVGAATFALSIAGLVLAWKNFASPFFALFSAGVLVLTMEHTPVHTLAYLLPRFEVIHEHVPSRILVVFNIGPAMLTGAAITAIQRNRAGPVLIAAAAASDLAWSD